MAQCVFVILFCALLGYQTLASAIGQRKEIDGDYIMEIGNQFNDSTLRLIGKVYKNFEHNVSKLIQVTRAERLVKQTCEANECDQWSAWSECPVGEGHFGWVTRTRECGQNGTYCTYRADQERTEHGTKMCAGKSDNSDASAESDPSGSLYDFWFHK